MKKIGFMVAVIFSMLFADYIEIKTAGGKSGAYISSKPRLYVCYDKRVKVISGNTMYLRYDGCARYRYSCYSNGKAHFGKYPNSRAARNALYRCQTARPRFVD